MFFFFKKKFEGFVEGFFLFQGFFFFLVFFSFFQRFFDNGFFLRGVQKDFLFFSVFSSDRLLKVFPMFFARVLLFFGRGSREKEESGRKSCFCLFQMFILQSCFLFFSFLFFLRNVFLTGFFLRVLCFKPTLSKFVFIFFVFFLCKKGGLQVFWVLIQKKMFLLFESFFF